AELRGLAGRPVRLYVFSNALYNPAAEALRRAGIRTVELTVPRALRDAAAPDRGWSAAFLDLVGRAPDAASFRRELAALLAGSAEGSGASGGQGAHGAPEAAASN